MAETLPPPKRHVREDEVETSQNSEKEKAESKVIRPKRVFHSIKKSDIFITGAIDVPFLALTIVILAIGLIMLFSASYPYSYYYYDNSYHYFIRQLIFAVAGVILMFVVSKLNYKIIKALQPIILLIGILLLVVVLFYHTDFSSTAGDEFRRYMKIPGTSFTFQPSDLAKFALIVTLAEYMSRYSRRMNTYTWGVIIPVIIIAVFCVLVGLERHVSAIILFAVIGLAMMFAGGTKKWLYIVGIIVVVIGLIYIINNPDVLPSYVSDKINIWLDKDSGAYDERWQINNSLYAIGSGSLFGVGLGNSKQKYLYVSEPQNDFIFSIVCEELGFVGAAVIIILFGALVIRGIMIARRSKDKFASLTTIGIMVQVGIQVVFNILVVTDSIPNTGISLPFFSYGGTALLVLLTEMGVVLSISRKNNTKKVQK